MRKNKIIHEVTLLTDKMTRIIMETILVFGACNAVSVQKFVMVISGLIQWFNTSKIDI